MKILLFTIITIFLNFSLYSQDEPEKIIIDFFNTYKNESVSKAIDDLYATNPWTERSKDAIQNLKTQLSRFNKDLVGEYYGYEKLSTHKLGQSYVLYSYFLKFDRQFLRVMFQFYKPKDKWKLASFQFDDGFDEDLEKAAKFYYETKNE